MRRADLCQGEIDYFEEALSDNSRSLLPARRRREIEEELKNQLETARAELADAENDIREFDIETGIRPMSEIPTIQPIVTSMVESMKVLMEIDAEMRREGVRI